MIALGGSASIAELDAAVIEGAQLTPDQQSVLFSGGPQTVVQNRLAWARTYLKGMGLFSNSTRGVWSVTPEGRIARRESLEPLRAAFAAIARRQVRGERYAEETTETLAARLIRSRLKLRKSGRMTY